MGIELPTEFEAAIFRHISSRTTDSALQSQLLTVRVTGRTNTGCGCDSDLLTSPEAPPTLAAYGSHGPLDGPDFESACVEFGGMTLLWFKEGRASCLEIAAFGEFFPENHADLVPFRLLEAPTIHTKE